MRLRNKETGETVEVEMLIKNGDGWKVSAKSLVELNKEWEDYEEPKEFWNIEWDGAICHTTETTEEEVRLAKQIGNYFETKEEAEAAVEKLKAWTRLRDKGFRFTEYNVVHNGVGDLCGQAFYNAGKYFIGDVEADLDLLLGGKDE